jgi:hypothetical protein
MPLARDLAKRHRNVGADVDDVGADAEVAAVPTPEIKEERMRKEMRNKGADARPGLIASVVEVFGNRIVDLVDMLGLETLGRKAAHLRLSKLCRHSEFINIPTQISLTEMQGFVQYIAAENKLSARK